MLEDFLSAHNSIEKVVSIQILPEVVYMVEEKESLILSKENNEGGHLGEKGEGYQQQPGYHADPARRHSCGVGQTDIGRRGADGRGPREPVQNDTKTVAAHQAADHCHVRPAPFSVVDLVDGHAGTYAVDAGNDLDQQQG